MENFRFYSILKSVLPVYQCVHCLAKLGFLIVAITITHSWVIGHHAEILHLHGCPSFSLFVHSLLWPQCLLLPRLSSDLQGPSSDPPPILNHFLLFNWNLAVSPAALPSDCLLYLLYNQQPLKTPLDQARGFRHSIGFPHYCVDQKMSPSIIS